MGAIAGQPSPKPQSVKSPVPSTTPKADAKAMTSDVPDLGAALDQELGSALDQELAGGASAEPVAPPTFGDTAAGQMIGKAAEYLPTVGGIVGGIAGAAGAGIPTMGLGSFGGGVAGAALGGAAGVAYRDLIETQILGRPQKSTADTAIDIAKGGAIEGAGQLAGGVAMKGLGKVGGAALKYGDEAIKAVKGAVTSAKNVVEEPVTKMIFERATHLTPQESGDAVKNLIVNNIQGKYAPFVKAYSELDNIGSTLPLRDEARRSLTQGIREWSANSLGGDDARMVRKFVDDLDAADNGMKLRNVISQIGDARSNAYRNGATQQANTLKLLQQKANDFMEGETTKLATRIAKGSATMEEMAGFEKMMAAQRNPNVPLDPSNLDKYAKSVANDYLKSLNTVKKDYAGFRTFLEDVAEQTKTKATNKGPVSFLEDIKNVPSEKLIDRMFDPKNAAALQLMQKETPEVFQEVTKARVKNLLTKASPTGTLDLPAFQKEVMKLPPDTRKLLFSSDEVATINKIALSPKLKRLASMEKGIEGKMIGYLQEISTIIGEKTPAAVKVPLRQAVGAPLVGVAQGIGQALMPQSQEPLPRTVDGLGE